MTLSAAEQYLIELINRARLDPLGEAARIGIGLNEGLAPGTISSNVREVLAPNTQLEASADAHSNWVLTNDSFSHTGVGGSQPAQRIAAAGYAGGTTGENLSLRWRTTAISLEGEIENQYEDLYGSASHRVNTFYGAFSEIGVSQVRGSYQGLNSVMLTENFGDNRETFITGVSYRDNNHNSFYSMGEGQGRIWISADGARATTGDAGGYGLSVDGDDNTLVSFGSGAARWGRLSLDMSNGNVKFDVVGTASDFHIELSGSATLRGGVDDARLIGAGDLDLRGDDANNTLGGNSGANLLNGMAGNDVIRGDDGNDRLLGGLGADRLDGGAARDRIDGQGGADRLTGGAGNDMFVFNLGRDTITDFSDNGDTIMLDLAALGLDAGTRIADVLAMADVTAQGVVIDFGHNNVLTVAGLRSVSALSNDLDLLG